MANDTATPTKPGFRESAESRVNAFAEAVRNIQQQSQTNPAVRVALRGAVHDALTRHTRTQADLFD